MRVGWTERTERASSESAGPVAAAAAVAEAGLEQEVRLDTVAPDTWNNGLTDRKIYWGGRDEADLKTEDFHLHHLHLEALSLLNVYAWAKR